MSTTPSIDASTAAPQLSVADLTLADLNPPPSAVPRPGLLICLPELDAASLEPTLASLAAAFPDEDIQVAIPGSPAAEAVPSTLHLLHYTTDRTPPGWVLTAADYAAASLASPDTPHALLLLGDPAIATRPTLLRRLADSIRTPNVDLVLPRFTLGPADGLVNSAILYPLTRALFGADIRFPLPIDAALSPRMAQRLASIGHRHIALGQASALTWPVAEAAIAGFSVRQVDAASNPPAIAGQDDFNALFNSVAGSLFADIEAKAAFWQRARALPAPIPQEPPPAAHSTELDAAIQPILEMIESFHLAQANLQEIWSLVLPPQSRLALKKLSLDSPAQFALEPALWARIVYDFALAFHLRTLNRGHLLGALIPLYLAWVASHLRAAANDATLAARHVDSTAAAFETEKSYLVSRWRWPDRFNP